MVYFLYVGGWYDAFHLSEKNPAISNLGKREKKDIWPKMKIQFRVGMQRNVPC